MALTNDFKVKNGLTVIDSISAGGNLSASEGFFDGDVGIGTNNPEALLEIASNSATDYLKLRSLGGGSTPIKLIFKKSSSEQGVIEYNRNGDLELYNTDADGGVMIDGSASAGGDFYVANSGNVGIGTTSPASKLQIDQYTVGSNGNQSVFGTASIFTNSGSDGLYLGVKNASYPNRGYSFKVTESGVNSDFAIKEHGSSGDRLTIKSGGNVGIGTGSPARSLHLYSSANNYIRLQTATVNGYSGVEFANDAQTWTLGVINNDTFALSNAAQFGGGYPFQIEKSAPNNSFIVKTSGNVGIGTASPTARLNVKASGSTVDQIAVTHSGNTVEIAQLGQSANGNSGGALLLKNNGGTDKIYLDAAGSSYFNGGNVGIGTTSPVRGKVEIIGDFETTESGNGQLAIISGLSGGSATAVDGGGQIVFGGSISTSDSTRTFGSVGGYKENGTSGNRAGYVSFGTRQDTGSRDIFERMRITSTGNVGIGTTSPTEKFHVSNGASGFSGTHNVRTSAIIESDNSNGTALAIMSKNTGNSAIWFGDQNSETVGQVYYNHPANYLAFGASGATQAVVNSTGLGIGTTNPAQKLHINGSVNGNVKALIQNTNSGSSAYATLGFQNNLPHSVNPALFLNGTNNTNYAGANSLNMYQFGSYNLGFVTDNTLRMVVAGDGNVGIGTTSPSAPLDISSSATGGTTIELDNTSTGGRNWTLYSSGAGNSFGAGKFALYDADAASVRMLIDTSGNVGIGETSPSSYFSPNLVVKAGANLGGITIRSNATTDDNYLMFADGTSGNERYRGFVNYNHTNDSMAIATAAATAMFINSSGNVGIGTTSPTTKLQVAGDSLVTGNSTIYGNLSVTGDFTCIETTVSTTSALSVTNTGTGPALFVCQTGVQPVAHFIDANGGDVVIADDGKVGIGTFSPAAKLDISSGHIRMSDGYKIDWGGTNARIDGSNADNRLRFFTSGVEKVRITSAGNVGIGTTNPSSLLHLESASSPSLRIKDTTQGTTLLAFSQDSNAHLGTFSNHPLVFDTNSTERMRIASSGNVGIGNASPSYKLQVTSADANDDVAYIHHDNPSQSSGTVLKVRSDAGNSTGYSLLDVQNNSVNALYVRGDGNVGIGTTSPGTLHGAAYGTTRLQIDGGTDRGQMIIEGDTDASIVLSDNGATANERVFATNVGGGKYTIKPLNDNGSSTAGGVAFTVSHGGNVGIGTTNPVSRLHIAENDNGGNAEIILENSFTNTGSSTDETTQIQGRFGGWDGSYIITGKEGDYTTAALRKSFLSFSTRTATTGMDEKMRITSTGNVGIGTTSPAGRLNIKASTSNGSTAFLLQNSNGNNNTVIYDNGTILAAGAGRFQGGGYFTGGNVGIGTTAPDNKLTVSGAISATGNISTTGNILSAGVNIDQLFGSGGGGGSFLPLAGGTMTGNIHFNDSVKANFGGSDSAWELEIYANSSNDAYIDKTATSVGDLIIQNQANDSDIIFKSDNGSGGLAAYFQLDGSQAQLKAHKNMVFFDDVKAKFGTSGDLEIYHDGSNSYIDDTNTGNLYVRADDHVYINAATGGTNMASFTRGGAVKLRYNDSQKFETTTNGVALNGTISYICGGDSEILAGQDTNGYYFATGNGQNLTKPVNIGDNNSYIRFKSGDAERMRILSGGNVGIGTTSPDASLHVATNSSSGTFRLSPQDGTYEDYRLDIATQAANDGALTMKLKDNTFLKTYGYYNLTGISHGVAGYEDLLHLKNTGKVGIGTGTADPKGKLHVLNGTAGSYTPNSEADTMVIESSVAGGISLIGTGSVSVRKQKIVFGTIGDPTGAVVLHDPNNGFMSVGTTTAGNYLKFLTGDSTEAMRLDVNGNVGIGTTSPASGLHLQGATNTSSGFTIENTSGGTSKKFGFQPQYNDDRLDIWYNSNATAAITIKDGGRVGIGTTSPDERLHVSEATGGETKIKIDSLDASRNNFIGITGHDNLLLAADHDDEGADSSIRMAVDGSEKVRIDSAGSVIVGTATVAAANAAADNIVIKGEGTAVGLTISNSSNAGTGTIFFGDAASSAAAGFRYNHNTGDMAISAEDNVTFAADNVGIGTTSPAAKLDVVGGHIRLDAGQSLQWDNTHERIEQSDGHLEFFVNNGEAMTLDTNGLGIGTTSPTSELHIEASDDPNLLITRGGVNKVKLGDSGSNNGGDLLLYDANGTLTTLLRSGASSYFNGGNVGIGVSTPSRKFQIDQTSTTAGGAYVYSNAIHTGTTTNSLVSIRQDNASATGTVLDVRGDGTGDKLIVWDNTSASLIVKDGGNVGIGTDSPSYTLDVAGTTESNTFRTPTGNIVIDGQDIYSNCDYNGNDGSIRLNRYGYQGGQTKFRDVVIFNGKGSSIVNVDGSSGNVGIGCSSPTQKLAVAGDGLFTSNLTVQGSLSVTGAFTCLDTTISVTSAMDITNHGTGPALLVNQTGSNDIVNFQDDGTSAFYIEDGGNVGIGCTNPTQKLDVAGNINTCGTITSTSTSTNTLAGKLRVNGTTTTGIEIASSSGATTGLKLFNNSSTDTASILNHYNGDLLIGTNNATVLTMNGTSSTFAGNVTANLSSEGTYFTGGSGGVRQLSITSGTNISAHALHTFNIASSNGKYKFDVNGATELSLDSSSATFAGDLTISGGDITLVGTGRIQGIDTVSSGTDAANKDYADTKLACTGGTMTGNVRFNDNAYLELGTSGDLQIYHSGASSNINNTTGHLYISNGANDSDIIFRSDDGSGGVTPYLTLDGSAGYTTVQKQMRFGDGVFLQIGDSADLSIYHQSGNNIIASETGPFILRQNLDDGDIIFQSDNGSGGVAEYFKLDGSAATANGCVYTNFPDHSHATFGSSHDFQIDHDGTNAVLYNQTGHLYISNDATDGDIVLRSDDGSGGVTEYLRLDGGLTRSVFSQSVRVADSKELGIGNSDDLKFCHNGTNSYIANYTGDLSIFNEQNDGDIIFSSDNGSGGVTPYVTIDGGSVLTRFKKNTVHEDNVKALFGNSSDLQIYHDSSNSYIQDVGTGDLRIDTSKLRVRSSGGTETQIIATENAGVELFYNDSNKLQTTASGIGVCGDALISGHVCATTKSFVIDNPTTDGKLRYSVVEGNEHGVTVRGSTCSGTIDLPAEWDWLVDESSVTAQITPVGGPHQPYVVSQDNKQVVVCSDGCYNYNIYGTRKDVEPLEVNM